VPSKLSEQIAPFYVMDVLERAKALESEGHSVVHFEVGEPDLPTHEIICEEAVRALRAGDTKYTHSLGTPELRETIAYDYALEYGVTVPPENIVVTMGSSPALFLAILSLIEPGEEVLITNPHYSCYPQIISIAGGVPRPVPIYEEEGYQLDVGRIKRAIDTRTRAILVNSPSNPTGVVLESAVMKELSGLGLTVISDEIYSGIVYEGESHTFLEYGDGAFIVSGFSKLYSMTGWRLGYFIVPPGYVRSVQKLQQNLFISPNSFIQRAGVAAIRKAKPAAREMVRVFGERRKLMLSGLRGLGFEIKSNPKGAFYVFVNAAHLGSDSLKLCFDILEKAHVAVTPGIDFGSEGEGYLRFSYATSSETILEGMRRLGEYIARK